MLGTQVTHLDPYEAIYGKYSRRVDESLYFKADPNQAHPFPDVARARLTHQLVEMRVWLVVLVVLVVQQALLLWVD